MQASPGGEGGCELAGGGVAPGGFCRGPHFSGRVAAAFPCDQVDGAGDGLGSVFDAHGAFDHFDPLYGVEGQLVDVDVAVEPADDGDAVDEDLDVLARKA